MPYREKRVYSGAMLEIERRHCTHTGKIIGQASLGCGTNASQNKINLKNAQQRLSRIMCENFTRGDLHITLTLAWLKPRNEQQKDVERFLRRLRNFCKKKTGKDLKYICVREDKNKRPHCHLVCNTMPINATELLTMWENGRVDLGTLDGSPDYGWLARYLTKQEEQDKNKKRWSQSKNLREPYSPEPKILNRKALSARPKVPKEYYVLSHYRWGTASGYEGEYIIAIRYDRKKELPAEIISDIEKAETWKEWLPCNDVGK